MGWEPAAAASDGRTYVWYRQDKANSCACASILMLMYHRQNKKLSEDSVRGWCGSAEGAVNKSKDGVRDYDTTGTQLDIIGTVLSEKVRLITSTSSGASALRDIKKARPSNPLICGVFWFQTNTAGDTVWQGGHAVVAINYHGGKVIFLDPEYGVFEVPEGDLMNYTITYPGAGGPSTGLIDAVRMP